MHDKNKWKLILASGSPRRRELLSHLKVPFEVQVSDVAEESAHSDPRAFALAVAELKGEAIARTQNVARTVVISSDTVVALDGEIFGKPRDISHAREILRTLAGKRHQVHTAVSIFVRRAQAWSQVQHVESTDVDFLPFDERLVENYLASGDCLDKAGAYGIQGQALSFIGGIHGCYASVMGFPLSRVAHLLSEILGPETKDGTSWQDLF